MTPDVELGRILMLAARLLLLTFVAALAMAAADGGRQSAARVCPPNCFPPPIVSCPPVGMGPCVIRPPDRVPK